MVENLFNSAHKHNSNKYRENYERIFREEEKKMKIFSYGTLMSGMTRNFIMKDVGGKKIKDAVLDGYRLYANIDHPTMREEDGYSVIGELWGFDPDRRDAAIRYLDTIEGYPDYYTRKEITIDREKVLIYIMTDMAFNAQVDMGDLKPVDSGDWREFFNKKMRETAPSKKRRKKKK